jgi:hypothetical protein
VSLGELLHVAREAAADVLDELERVVLSARGDVGQASSTIGSARFIPSAR